MNVIYSNVANILQCILMYSHMFSDILIICDILILCTPCVLKTLYMHIHFKAKLSTSRGTGENITEPPEWTGMNQH